MAPLNGSAKPRKLGSARSSQGRKQLVPAIPLPYVKRQAAAAAVAAAASAPASAASEVSSPAASTATTMTTANASSPPPQTTIKQTNGTSKTTNPREPSISSAMPQLASLHLENGSQVDSGSTKPTLEQSSDAVVSGSEQASVADEAEGPTKAFKTKVHPDQPTQEPKGDVRAQAPNNDNPVEPPVKANVLADTGAATSQLSPKEAFPVVVTDDFNSDQPHSVRQPTSISPTRYPIPPSFQPANRPLGMVVNGDIPRGPRPPMYNGPHLHQPHPSNSSIHFGAFHGSASSSPAPPLSGGIAPPPGMPIADGRAPYMAQSANEFPPMMPYRPDVVPINNFDSYGRPAMAYGPMSSYPPYGNGFGPSSQQNFHEPHPSTHPGRNGMYPQYHPGQTQSSVPGSVNDSKPSAHTDRMFTGSDFSHMMPKAAPPPPMLPRADDADDLIGYFQQQFGTRDFSDCVLELLFVDNRAPPVRIPGHKIIFARSGPLGRLLQSRPSQQKSAALPTVVLETESKWIRPDSFYTAVQRLYGLRLFEIPPLPTGAKQGESAGVGSIADRFDFAVSYAAAGHLLEWDSVIRRGCEMAIQLLDMQTIERALEFALEEHNDQGSHDVYKYGEGARAIVSRVVALIANVLPPSFVIDGTVSDPNHYTRLPPCPTPSSSPVAAKASPRDFAVRLGRGRKSQQITGIQFGDLSAPGGESDAQKATQGNVSVSQAMLSRALVNLPFTHLRELLDYAAPSNANGWTRSDHRIGIIKDVVAVREKRRLEALEAVKARRVPNSDFVLRQLSSPEPRYFDRWTILGWQEELLGYGNSDGPILARHWAPLIDHQNGIAPAEYP